MATYVDAFKGYIADVPRVWFKRCDGKVFYFDEISQASANPQTNFTEINGGWSIYPVAYIPGQSTMEISMTSAQFNADMFAMANGNQLDFSNGAGSVPTTERGIVGSSHGFNLKHQPGILQDGSFTVYVSGMTYDSNLSAPNTFCIELDSSGKPFIEFSQDVTGEVEVVYEYPAAGKRINITNKESAIGEAIFKWPVYGGAEDCSDQAIKGYVVMRVYRCRVTQGPGFDTSYKSAATNQVTWAAMDAKREDGAVYSLAYMPA